MPSAQAMRAAKRLAIESSGCCEGLRMCAGTACTTCSAKIDKAAAIIDEVFAPEADQETCGTCGAGRSCSSFCSAQTFPSSAIKRSHLEQYAERIRAEVEQRIAEWLTNEAIACREHSFYGQCTYYETKVGILRAIASELRSGEWKDKNDSR